MDPAWMAPHSFCGKDRCALIASRIRTWLLAGMERLGSQRAPRREAGEIASDALRGLEARLARAGWGFAPRSPVSRSEHRADRTCAHRGITLFGSCG